MENITTYDFIVRQRKRKNAQDRQNSVRIYPASYRESSKTESCDSSVKGPAMSI
jgi:hypothetical protein